MLLRNVWISLIRLGTHGEIRMTTRLLSKLEAFLPGESFSFDWINLNQWCDDLTSDLPKKVRWYNMIKQVVLFDVSCLPGRERSKANSSFKRWHILDKWGFEDRNLCHPSKSLYNKNTENITMQSNYNDIWFGIAENVSRFFGSWYYLKSCFYLSLMLQSYPVMGLRVPEITPWWILPEACGSLAYDPRVWSPRGWEFWGMPPWGLAFTQNPGTDPWDDCIFLPYIYHEIKSNVGRYATHTHTWLLWVMVWFRAGISTTWERCMEIYHACICFLTMLLVHLLDF